jgi:hypothetical protein
LGIHFTFSSATLPVADYWLAGWLESGNIHRQLMKPDDNWQVFLRVARHMLDYKAILRDNC